VIGDQRVEAFRVTRVNRGDLDRASQSGELRRGVATRPLPPVVLITEPEVIGRVGRDGGRHPRHQKLSHLRPQSRGYWLPKSIARQRAADIHLISCCIDYMLGAPTGKEAPFRAEVMIEPGDMKIGVERRSNSGEIPLYIGLVGAVLSINRVVRPGHELIPNLFHNGIDTNATRVA